MKVEVNCNADESIRIDAQSAFVRSVRNKKKESQTTYFSKSILFPMITVFLDDNDDDEKNISMEATRTYNRER